MEHVDILAKKIWDYMLMHQELKQADLIFVLGSNDIRVADRAAELFLQGFAPLVVCSGGNGKNTKYVETEAKVFSERMIKLGVPREKIILEPNSTNTGENVRFTRMLLGQLGIAVSKVIAVQKPYMERRTFATIRKQWPEIELTVTSPQLTCEEYRVDEDFNKRFINVMVGDLIRIREYPKLSFQIEQEIPEDVWHAGQELLKLGYDKYAIKS